MIVTKSPTPPRPEERIQHWRNALQRRAMYDDVQDADTARALGIRAKRELIRRLRARDRRHCWAGRDYARGESPQPPISSYADRHGV